MSGDPFIHRLVDLVNFEKKLYWCGSEREAKEACFDTKGWHAIDELMLNPIMRFNSAQGVKTAACCSGHPGCSKNAFIRFKVVTKKLADTFSSSQYWTWDAGIKCANIKPSAVESLFDWVGALHELYSIANEYPNTFTQSETL